MIKVLFVCMGNICRSPTAHAVMQDLVNRNGLADEIEIDSAGTHAYHVGEQSDPRSRAKAAEKGIDMNYIRARKISIRDYDAFDYILAMDQHNLELIQEFAPSKYRAKISLFLSFAADAGLTDRKQVPDPYYGGADGFEDVFKLVESGCQALLKQLREEL